MIDERVLDEVYFSVDGEFDGSHPPKHSMLSVAAVAFTLREGVIGTFSRNIMALGRPQPPPWMAKKEAKRAEWLKSIGLPSGHTMDERVWNEFWVKHPKAWEAANQDQVVPAVAMKEFSDFYHQMTPNPRNGVFIEYPGGIDYFWCHWYFLEYLGEDPFGHSRSMSMKSYAAAVLNQAFCHSTNRNMPKRWFESKIKHTHIALDDALGQAHLAIRMMCEHLEIDLPLL